MIECINLTKLFGELTAVNNFCFKLKEKEFISILGPSGCGKSTLLRLIAGLEVPSRGKVMLYNQEISGEKITLAPENRKFGMIFQDFTLFPHLSVKENISFGVNGSKKEKIFRVEELLNLVNLPHLSEKMPHQISGGEQQRIAVARALAPKPRLILMDEPFSNLDYKLRQQLRYDIRNILKKNGVATILVTHDQVEAITFSEKVILMKDGELLQSGSPLEIYNYPKTLWASKFVGESNHLSAKWKGNALSTTIGHLNVPAEIGEKTKFLVVRPEDFIIESNNGNTHNGKVKSIEFLGPTQNIEVELCNGETINITDSPHLFHHINEIVNVKVKRFLCFNDAGEIILDLN